MNTYTAPGVRKSFSKTSDLRKSEINRLKDLCTTIRLIRKKEAKHRNKQINRT